MSLSLDKPSLAEDGSQNPATVTATLSGTTTQEVSVTLEYFGSATVTADYTRSDTLITIGAAWDAVTDPLVGGLSDHSRSRFGRRRPFMLAVAIPLGYDTAGRASAAPVRFRR